MYEGYLYYCSGRDGIARARYCILREKQCEFFKNNKGAMSLFKIMRLNKGVKVLPIARKTFKVKGKPVTDLIAAFA